MMARDCDWTTLNAFVDGELPSSEASAVLRMASADPKIAEQISLLSYLKGETRASAPEIPADLYSLLPPEAAQSDKPQNRSLVAAIALIFLLVPLSQLAPPRDAQSDSLLATAERLHENWLGTEGLSPELKAPVLLDALATFGRLPIVPDLTSAGLSITLATVTDTPAGRLLHIGYRGHRGCHFSLFVATADNIAMPHSGDGLVNEQQAKWRAGDLDYLLLARGMDIARFELIFEKVEAATRAVSPISAPDRAVLAANARASAHCHA